MPDVDVHIRRAETLDDYFACLALQKEVWGYVESEDIAAQPILMIGNRYGGSLLLAQDGDGRNIGFAFAMPGWKRDKKRFWWSHMTAVVPEFRSRNVGLKLKQRQKEEALLEGVEKIEWTFDPLQAMNAHFNICKLGVVVREYEENVYGYTSSPLHRGLPTDRLVAEWDLKADKSREESVVLRQLDRIATINPGGGEPNLSLSETQLLLEIPADLNALKSSDRNKAKQWQVHVRTACEHYFRAGYAITDFIHVKEPQAQAFYLVSRTSTLL